MLLNQKYSGVQNPLPSTAVKIQNAVSLMSMGSHQNDVKTFFDLEQLNY